ncbi:helix-turn-helix domain-containing protein [Niameybacter massiliensis]|uniref:helix-turn-helix domain-containing protein n=1 Tax=Niameybacter massiliensis TaxID=1658108 RepID=UPI0006B52110|nr:helix-turn-helix transcriptional regulator [Niameybacter massiliensis]
MDKTKKLKEIILSKYSSIREFSKVVNIPSTTLISSLERGIGGMAIDRIIKICDVLDIDIKTFEPISKTNEELNLSISTKEKVLLSYYNQLNDLGKNKLIENAEDLTHNTRYSNVIELAATSEEEKDYLMPVAAHADNEDDLDLLRQDLDEL